MHVALLRAHNRIVDHLRLADTPEDRLFADARRI
jgi:hypothetical protein